MNTDFRPPIIRFLEVMGYSAEAIAKMNYDTELVKDLRLEGDSLIETLELLSEKFDIDFSGMNYDLYGRDEGYYLSPARIFDFFKREKLFLRPITLKMIEESITRKKWVFD